MEIDDLKQHLRVLEQRLARDSRLSLATRHEHGRLHMQRVLGPLYVLHAGQIALGVVLALLVGPFWVGRLAEPHLLVAGLLIHAYAIAMIVLGARTLARLGKMDFAAPVLVLQQQLARARRAYVENGLFVGLPWWFLWLPLVMLLFAMVGVDLYAGASRAWLVTNVVVGAAGIVATLWLGRALWYRPTDAAERRKLAQDWAGRRLLQAQRVLDELAEFAKE